MITIVNPEPRYQNGSDLASDFCPVGIRNSPGTCATGRVPEGREQDPAGSAARILGELRKLGIKSVSRQTVKMILKEHGIDPGPKRGKGSWDEFLKIHADTLWQCDFLSKPMWTAKGLVDVYLLVFLHLGSRRVWSRHYNEERPYSCRDHLPPALHSSSYRSNDRSRMQESR